MPSLVLASGSARRRALLKELGVAFEVRTVETEELSGTSFPSLSAVGLAMENARLKATAVARLYPERWILGAYTVVSLDGRVYGKPTGLEQARDFLADLSGRTHEVITGCALLGPQAENDIFCEISRVTFRQLSVAMIEQYLCEVNVLDKAGGYALQEKGECLVERVEGSQANVVGLPIEHLAQILQKRGLLSSFD